MKKTKDEKEPKIRFNRGNPDSPVPPGRSVQDVIEEDTNKIEDEETNEDINTAGKKKQKIRDIIKIKGNIAENTELLTF